MTCCSLVNKKNAVLGKLQNVPLLEKKKNPLASFMKVTASALRGLHHTFTVSNILSQPFYLKFPLLSLITSAASLQRLGIFSSSC